MIQLQDDITMKGPTLPNMVIFPCRFKEKNPKKHWRCAYCVALHYKISLWQFDFNLLRNFLANHLPRAYSHFVKGAQLLNS